MNTKNLVILLMFVLLIFAAFFYLDNQRKIQQSSQNNTIPTELNNKPVDKEAPQEVGNKKEPANMANPASVFCESNGKIRFEKTAQGEYGVCVFPDNTECEEWAYYRNECNFGAVAEAINQS